MLNIDLNGFSREVDQLADQLESLSKKELRKAHFASVRRAVKSVRAVTIKTVSKRTGVKASTLRKKFKFGVMSPSKAFLAELKIDRRGVSAKNQYAKQKYKRKGGKKIKAGVIYGRGPNKKYDPQAFIAKAPNGHTLVFSRENEKRSSARGVNIEIREEADSAVKRFEFTRMYRVYYSRMRHEMQYRIDKLRRRQS